MLPAHLDQEIYPAWFIEKLKARQALLAITPSSLRNQGAAGMIGIARRYVVSINLSDFKVENQVEFKKKLDQHTEALMRAFPEKAKKNWGAARKALNIYLRDVAYTYPLVTYYGLQDIDRFLELPLDSNSYDGLKNDYKSHGTVPKWPGVKRLDSRLNAQLQAIAEDVGLLKGLRPVHLDAIYWRRQQIEGVAGGK